MPPVTFIGVEAFTASLACPVPRGARPGDLLLAVVLTTDTATLAPPDGWVQIARVSAPTTAHAAVWLLQHRAADPEPAAHTFEVDAGDAWGAVLLYRGLAEFASTVAAVAADQTSGTTHKAPDATATTYSDLLLEVWASFTALAWSAPGDMRARFNSESPDAGVAATLVIADALREATGSLGGSTATAASPGCVAIACSFVLAADPPPRAASIVRPTPGAIGIQEV